MRVYTQDYIEYKLAGVCTFLSEETIKIMGYDYKNLFEPRHLPILIYSKSGEIDGPLFGIMNNKHKYINPEIIKDLYDLNTGQELYPELFI